MQNQINTKLINKFIVDLYRQTEFKDIELQAGAEMFLHFIKIERNLATYEYHKAQLKAIITFLKKRQINSFTKINDQILLEYIKFSVGNKNITINKRIGSLKYCISFLEKREIISHVELKIEKLKETRTKIETIDTNTINQIIEYLRDKSIVRQLAFRLLVGTGIRRSEIIKITKKNINLSENSIYLENTKTGDPRYIFFDNETKNLILKQLEENTNSEYLFYNTQNKVKVTTSFIDGIIRDIKKGLRIKILSPHKLRHTYATYLLENGADIESVRLLLGHRTYEMTKRYLHIKNENLKKTSLLLNPLNSRS